MACTEHGDRHSSMSHCRRGGGGCLPSPFVQAACYRAWQCHFSLPTPSPCRLCACGCVCAGVRVRVRRPASWLRGGGGGACLAGRLAQLLSSCLRQPLGQSGLSGKPLLERHQSRHARVGKKKKKIKKRAKELRMSREEPEPWDQETGNGFLIEAWRRINPAALFKQKKGNGFCKNVLREYILMEAFSVRH